MLTFSPVDFRAATLNALLTQSGTNGGNFEALIVDIFPGTVTRPADPSISVGDPTTLRVAYKPAVFGSFDNLGNGSVVLVRDGNDVQIPLALTSSGIYGTAAWFRIYTNIGTPIIDGTVGVSGENNADMELNEKVFAAVMTPPTITRFGLKIPATIPGSSVKLSTALRTHILLSWVWGEDNMYMYNNSHFFDVYSGTPPATADDPLSGNTQLMHVPFGTGGVTYSGTPTGSQVSLPSVVASAVNGVPSFFRLWNSVTPSKTIQGLVGQNNGLQTADIIVYDSNTGAAEITTSSGRMNIIIRF